MSVEITVIPTRTENLLTFELNRALIPPGTGLSFPNAASAESHPVARAIFQVKGVCSVWILDNAIDVTKDETARWAAVKPGVVEAIRSACNSLPA
ncbi:MAG: NifU N-terminal domain-containing protein [Nitrospinales bacterium]